MISHCKVQRGITQPLLGLFLTYLYNGIEGVKYGCKPQKKQQQYLFQMALLMALQEALTPRAITRTTTASGSPSSGGLWMIFGDQWGALDRRPIGTAPLLRAGSGSEKAGFFR